MPAPTALLRAQERPVEEQPPAGLHDGGDMTTDPATELSDLEHSSISPINTEPELMHIDSEGRPTFAPEKASQLTHCIDTRRIPIPPNRLTPLKSSWSKIYPPLVTHLKLQVRMNVKARAVELRTSKQTTDSGALQKGEDFVKAFTLGFDVDDAIALLRLDDLYIEMFEIRDVKLLTGEALGRAIGRIAGKDGKTKFAIENASRTRIVLADQKVVILGGFSNIHIARTAICSLILGAQPGKVYGNLRTVAARMKERF